MSLIREYYDILHKGLEHLLIGVDEGPGIPPQRIQRVEGRYKTIALFCLPH